MSLTTVPVPINVEPLKKSTVPVGEAGPVAAGVIVAVSVTTCPETGKHRGERDRRGGGSLRDRHDGGWRGGAAGIIRIADVRRGDRVGADGQGRGRVSGHIVRERDAASNVVPL